MGKTAFKQARGKRSALKFLPFDLSLSISVQTGTTQATFRLKKYPMYPKPGQPFSAHVNCQAIDGAYLCRRRVAMTLGDARKRYWLEIGMSSPEDYDTLMRHIHGRQILDWDMRGYLYFFERIA